MRRGLRFAPWNGFGWQATCFRPRDKRLTARHQRLLASPGTVKQGYNTSGKAAWKDVGWGAHETFIIPPDPVVWIPVLPVAPGLAGLTPEGPCEWGAW